MAESTWNRLVRAKSRPAAADPRTRTRLGLKAMEAEQKTI
jgi:hypothetical protein